MSQLREHHRKQVRDLEDRMMRLQREAASDAERFEIGGSMPEARAAMQIAGGEPVAMRLPDYGFANVAQFFSALVRRDAGQGRPQDDRLTAAMAAATIYSNEGTAPEGGWAMPPAFVAGFTEAVAGIGTLLGAMNPQVVPSGLVQLAVEANTPGGTSGLTAAKTGEGAAATGSKPALQGRNIVLSKAVGLCHVTEELMEDSPAAGDAVARILAREVRAIAERWLLRGSGVGGEPLGILNGPATIAVTGSGAGTLTTTHLGSAFGRFMAGAGSFIVAGPSATGALRKIEMDGGRLSLPVIQSLELPAIGTVGDAILVNPAGFLTFTRGVQAQATPVFFFDQGLQSIKAVLRIGQVPVLSAAITPALDTSNAVSHAVTVATRS